MRDTIIAIIAISTAIAIFAFCEAWKRVSREEMRTEVAKECIEHGGKYKETMFRRRPVCKQNN